MLKARKKITRAELKHDPLLDGVYKFRSYWNDHRAQVNRYGPVAVIVIIIFLIGLNWRGNQDQKAAEIAGIATIDYAQNNFSQIIGRVSPLVDEYAGLPSFGAALYLLARSELNVADTALAEQHFKAFLADYGNDDLLGSGAYAGLGVIADSRDDQQAAAAYFHKASMSASTRFMEQSNLVSAARSYLRAGQPEQTVKLLRSPVEDGSMDRRLNAAAQTLLAEAEVTLGRM